MLCCRKYRIVEEAKFLEDLWYCIAYKWQQWSVWRVDSCSSFIASLFRESAKLKAGKPRKYEGLWFFFAVLTVLIANHKMLLKTLLHALLLIRLRYCLQQAKSFHYRLMPFQNGFIIKTFEVMQHYYIISLNMAS